jgi:hypothetical protein
MRSRNADDGGATNDFCQSLCPSHNRDAEPCGFLELVMFQGYR